VQSQIVDAAELERVRLLFPPLPPRTLNVKYFKVGGDSFVALVRQSITLPTVQHEEYLPDLSTAFCLGKN